MPRGDRPWRNRAAWSERTAAPPATVATPTAVRRLPQSWGPWAGEVLAWAHCSRLGCERSYIPCRAWPGRRAAGAQPPRGSAEPVQSTRGPDLPPAGREEGRGWGAIAAGWPGPGVAAAHWPYGSIEHPLSRRMPPNHWRRRVHGSQRLAATSAAGELAAWSNGAAAAGGGARAAANSRTVKGTRTRARCIGTPLLEATAAAAGTTAGAPPRIHGAGEAVKKIVILSCQQDRMDAFSTHLPQNRSIVCLRRRGRETTWRWR